MGNENVKFLKQSVASIPRDNDKEIEIDGGAGEMGKNIFKVSHWKRPNVEAILSGISKVRL